MTDTTTHAQVDLDELEQRARSAEFGSVRNLRADVLLALIAEVRAHRAAPAVTPVQAGALLDAMRYPDNGALHCRWCSAGPQESHESRCWYAEQVRRVDAAKRLLDELALSYRARQEQLPPAPPAVREPTP